MDASMGLATLSGIQRVTIPIYNLGCGGDGAHLAERVLAQVPGVSYVYVNPATEMAYIEYDPNLSDPDQLAAALKRSGFGPLHAETRVELVPVGDKTVPLNTQRLALAAGLWSAAFYTLCIVATLLLPAIFHMRIFWEMILIGFDWTQPWTFVLGLVEAFLYGVLGVWSFAAVYKALPQRVVG